MIPPVVKEVVVPVSLVDAFRRFTDEIHLWWPMHTHSVGRDDCRHVVLEVNSETDFVAKGDYFNELLRRCLLNQ